MAISRIYDISKRSLMVYRKAMDAAAHNIANSGNPNYSRQRLSMTSERPDSDGKFQWGSGIKIGTIERVEDNLLTSQILSNTLKFNKDKKESELLSQVEVVFGEPTEFGVANYLNKFFDSWSSLSASPNSVEARKEVLYSAENLASKIESIFTSIDNIKSDMISSFTDKTKELNSLLNQLKEVNSKINQTFNAGSSPNDLKDKRDEILKKLSEIAPVNVNLEKSGIASVNIGGVFAVNLDAVTEFKVDRSNKGKLELRTKVGNVKAVLSGGEMAGISETFNSKLSDYSDRLDNMMNVMVREVNSIHSKGYTIDSNPQTRIKFFDGYNNGKLKINRRVLNDPLKIAISSDGTAGNGEYANQLTDLKTKKMIDGLNIMEYYGNIVNDVGNTINSANSKKEAVNLVLQQLESQKDSITAVSIDEEMTDILKYQKSFNASAKLIKMANEVLDVLLSMV